MTRFSTGATALALVFGLVAPAAAAPANATEVNVYTYREQPLIQPLFDRFTKETGIKVNSIYATKGLEERIRAEGAASPADLLIAVDVTILERAREMGVTQPIKSPALEAAVPAGFRDPAGNWVGLTYRARVIYASKERVKETSLSYADLADPKWKGKVCTRSGQHPYTLGLVSGMIAVEGVHKTENWLKAVKQNLAAKPSGNDRSQVKEIFSGTCDLALGNTYYYGLMSTNDKEPEQKDWAGSIKVIMPKFTGGGTHVNISGAVMAKNAPNREAALKLLDFMVGEEAQEIYAGLNYEYPVRPGVKVAPLIAGLGQLQPDATSLNEVAKHRPEASSLVDKVGFDDGPAS